MTNPAILFGDVVERLKTTVHQGRTFDAAQVRVVGLDDIREAAGAHWPAIKERVRVNSLEFLRGCLASEDIVIPAGDGFLVLYAEREGRDLARECAAMQDALNAFYVGEEGMQKLRAKVRGLPVDAKNMHAVLGFQGGDFDVEDEAPPPPPLLAERKGPHHDLVFAPTWSAAQQGVATYCVTPIYRGQDGRRQFGYDPDYRERAQLSEQSFLDLDLRGLARALAGAETMLNGGSKCLIGISVHATTLRHRALRSAFLAELWRSPESVRRYLTARIAEVEPGAPLISLSEWVGALRGICRRVTVELHPSEPSLTSLGGVGAWGVSCHLPLAGQASPEQRRQCAALLARWTSALHRQNLKFTVDSVIDPALFEVAYRLGADFITSEVVWPPAEAPLGLVAFGRARAAAAFAARRRA